MKILFIGDPHLKITKFDLAKKFLTWINEIIIENKPDVVVNLGDTFDTHAVLRSEVMTEFMEHVYQSIKICPYIYLIGNHDQYKPNDSTYHALSHLKDKIKDFVIVDKVSIIDGITYIPYVHDPLLFPDIETEIGIAHQTFIGADYGSFYTKDGVDPSKISKAKLIVSGHIHKRQELVFKNISIKYPGTPFSQSASDIDEIKGISIIDTSDLSEQFIRSPLPVWKSINVTVDSNNNIGSLHDTIALNIDNKNYWVLTITGPKIEIISYLNSKEYKSVSKGNNIKIKTVFTDKHKKKNNIKAQNISVIIDDYIENFYKGSLDKNELKSRVKDLTKEVESLTLV